MAKPLTREILGHSEEIVALKNLIAKIAPSPATVLVRGESGTGKELVARAIHEWSLVATGPFVAVNCGAIPENLIESELFGHKKGSFTGAIQDKPGLFEVAENGTLFLDEVGELPLSLQVKLLRALQDKTIRRVGANESIKINCRLVTATNKNLEKAIKRGEFREDLYYRLNVIQIDAPPLRVRGDDVLHLAQVFLETFSKKMGKTDLGFSDSVRAVLRAYSWPGNVRQLENVIERGVALASGFLIDTDVLPPELTAPVTLPLDVWDYEVDTRDSQWSAKTEVQNFKAFLKSKALEVSEGSERQARDRLKLTAEEWKKW